MTITVKKDKNKEICSLNQYDAGQTLQIEGLDLTGCAMYWGGAYLADEDPPVESEKREFTGIEVDGVEDLTAGGICAIPDKALRQIEIVKGIIYQTIDGVSETIATVEFTPTPQYMPTDYVSADNTVTLTVLIDARIALALPEAVESEVESQLPGAIAEADLVPYTGATKAVDLNGQNLSGINRLVGETCTTDKDNTVVLGDANSNTADYGTVLGGIQNTNSGEAGVMLGGVNNKNTADAGTILGGGSNNNSGFGGVILAGTNNMNSGVFAVLSGTSLNNTQYGAAMFGEFGTMPTGGLFAIANGTIVSDDVITESLAFWIDTSGNAYVGDMDEFGAGGFNLALFTMVDGQLLYDGEPITGESFDNAEVLAKFSEQNEQLYYDGMPISGVNVAKYATVNELDTNEDLIIAQVTATQESWRSARRKQDATFTFVEVPKMPISDFTASAYKDGVLYADLGFEANDSGLSEEGIGSFTVAVPGERTIYVYIEHTTTVTALDIEVTFGWNRLTYTLVDGEPFLDTIAHFPDANFTSLPEFTELIINATNGALTGLQEFITTDTANNEKTALRWIREEGIYIVNADGDWRKYTSSYIADDYNRLPDDAQIGSTAITLADVEQDKEPERFEPSETYSTVYARLTPITVTTGGYIVNTNDGNPETKIAEVEGSTDCLNRITTNYTGWGGFDALGTPCVIYGMYTTNPGYYYSYAYITVETYTDISGIILTKGWNKIHFNDIPGGGGLPANLTTEHLEYSDIPIFKNFNTDYVRFEDLDFLDGLFSFSPPITRKAGGYTKLESGWEETVCIDPLVEVKANKVATIDANSTDEEYPSAKAVFDFLPEIDVDELVPTMTEYATVLTLNKGNYWTTTASIEFGLPTPVAGKVNTIDLDLTVANAAHAITWSAAVEWAGAVAHVFGAGHHIVSGQYSPVSSKWVLVGSAVGVTA